MATSRETVLLLCKSIVTRLENRKSIAFDELAHITAGSVEDRRAPPDTPQGSVLQNRCAQPLLRAEVSGPIPSRGLSHRN